MFDVPLGLDRPHAGRDLTRRPLPVLPDLARGDDADDVPRGNKWGGIGIPSRRPIGFGGGQVSGVLSDQGTAGGRFVRVRRMLRWPAPTVGVPVRTVPIHPAHPPSIVPVSIQPQRWIGNEVELFDVSQVLPVAIVVGSIFFDSCGRRPRHMGRVSPAVGSSTRPGGAECCCGGSRRDYFPVAQWLSRDGHVAPRRRVVLPDTIRRVGDLGAPWSTPKPNHGLGLIYLAVAPTTCMQGGKFPLHFLSERCR